MTAPIQVDAIIMLGKGPSAAASLPIYQERWPRHELWTLNDHYIAGSCRHFDIHFAHQLGNDAACIQACTSGAEVIISPLRDPVGPHEVQFPLASIVARWGVVLFESTVDYMLAYALWLREAGLRFHTIALPGLDFEDLPHALARDGAHFWLGLCKGLGIEIIRPDRSALLRRDATVARHVRGMAEYHYGHSFLYGQPDDLVRRAGLPTDPRIRH